MFGPEINTLLLFIALPVSNKTNRREIQFVIRQRPNQQVQSKGEICRVEGLTEGVRATALF
jgi:hypothetical protein